MIAGTIQANKMAADSASNLNFNICGILHRSGNNQYIVALPKKTVSEAILIVLSNGPTSAASSSVAGAAQLLRVVSVLELIQLLAFKQASSKSGTWTTGNPAFGQDGSSGVNTGHVHSRTTAQNAYALYSGVVIPSDGILRIGFYGSAASSTSVEVQVDGVVIDTFGINTVTGLIKKQWTVTPGSHDIKITKKDSGTAGLNVYGPNFYDVTDFGTMPNGIDINAYGYFRTVVGRNYITNAGACDYAIFNYDTNLWAGSYHGGETSLSLSITVGGSDQSSIANGAMFAGRNINIRQSTVIDWGAGITMSPVISTDFCRGGWMINYEMRGSGVGTWEDFYPVMTTTTTSFDQVTAPVSATITLDTVTALGGITNITQRNSTTGQTIQTLWSPVNHANNTAGANVTSVTGSYNKLYDGVIANKSNGVSIQYIQQQVIRLCD